MPIPSYYNQINGLSPKIWYRFNETSGTPVNSGSLSTTSTFINLLLNEQTDVDGRAIYLNGSSSYIQLPAHASFALFNDRSFTVECWIKINNSDTSGTGDHTIFRLNPASSPHKVIDLKVHGNYNNNRGKVSLTSNWTTEILSSAIDNGQWHHIVYTFNTSSVKLYVDGSLAASTTPTNLDASFVYDTSTKKLIGAGYTGISQTTIGNYYKGRIDEFAVYDYELTSQNILDNFNAGASVEFASDVLGTASALMVMPAFSTECVQLPEPMTASSLFVDTYVSNFDYVDGIQKIISDLSPHQWIKFDSTTDVTRTNPFGFLTNYGSGGGSFSTFAIGNAYQQKGPAQEPRLELRLGSGTGSLQPGFATTTNSAFFTDEVSDNNFSIGIWFKMPSSIDTSEKQIFSYSGGTNSAIGLRVNNKKVVFTVQTSHTTYTHTETNDISENEWHLAVIRLDLAASTLKYYLDGTEVFSDTAIQGTRNTPTSFSFGKSGGNGTDTTTKFQEVAHFFVSSYSSATATVIDNLWDAGTRQNQAKGVMTFPILQFDNKYDQLVASLNPIQKLGFNETTGTILENTGSNINTSFSVIGTNYTRGTSVLTKNRYGYNFTNKNTYVSGAYGVGTNAYADNTMTISVYAKVGTVSGSDSQIIALYGAGNNAGSGIGFVIAADANGPLLRIVPTVNPATWTTYSANNTTYFGDYHLYTATRDGSTVKFYIDGKLISTNTYTAYNFTDSGFVAIGGGETVWLGAAAATVDKTIDEFASFDYALSAQQILEMYQAIEIDRMNATNATFPMPTNIAGTGYTDTPAPMTASSLFVEPVLTAETNELAIAMDAFAEFILPNFGGNVVIDANYGHTAATASAVFHDPQFQIGDFHSADHMNASAEMVHPAAIAAGSITVSTAVGGPAVLVMPGIVTIKGAQHFAEPMRSNAIFPLPPAYIQLTDDDWFVRLLEGHADKKAEFIQGTITNLPNQASTDIIKGGFLSFFDDILADITQNTNPNYITSEIPNHYFDAVGLQEYDENGDLIPLDTTKSVARVTPSRGVLNPTPMVSKGYFDNQERKAVRIENIEIPLPGTSSNFSIRPYNVEFSFKTTKANQVITYGQYTSPSQTNSRKVGAIGLYNGRIYLAEDFYTPVSAFGETGLRSLRVAGTVPHPINFTDATYVGYMLGNKNIADGQWHHVIIQKGYTDGRTQIWIDGKLDKQLGVQSNDGRSTGYASISGSDASQEVRPYIVGFNSADTNLSSDFQTSAWNFYPGRFLEERDISLNYTAYGKWKPIKAEPMTVTAKATDNNKAAGNRSRALMLYWWPVTRQFGDSESLVSNDRGQFGPNDVPTFDSELYTYDYLNEKPQEYYGWDIFPISITGYKGMLGGDPAEFLKPGVLQSGGLYIDPITSAPRYLDVLNDIDLSAFDAIFFRNFPDQSEELDAYIREQFSDEYFNIKERDLYNDFIASLRAAVDTGISLFITNSQLAIDLGIVDKVEQVPDFYEGTSDDYAPSILPATASNLSNGDFIDVHRNNRLRVVNTVEGLTNESGYIWKDWAYFAGGIAGEAFSGEPDRPFISLENRPNGLQVGDTFVISDATTLGSYFDAVPFANVKVGKIVTAFANTIRQNLTEIENPYKNYATCIAVEPGTILNGKALGGKIFVNFTERLETTVSAISGTQIAAMRPSAGARDIFAVDLIQDEWINLAYNEGEITLAKRDELLNASYNLDRRLAAEIAGQNRPAVIAAIQKEKTWDSNGLLLLTQRNQLDDIVGAGRQKDNLGSGQRETIIIKTKKSGDPTTGKVTTSQQWFTFEYSWQYPRLQIRVLSMLTRGFRWLSEKIVDEGKVNRVQAMTAIATGMPMPVVTADKDRTVYVTSMLANARIIHAPGYALADVSNTTLPLTANASFGEFVKSIKPDVFNASALLKEPRTTGIEEDEIVVYMIHVDPILYLREDIIK